MLISLSFLNNITAEAIINPKKNAYVRAVCASIQYVTTFASVRKATPIPKINGMKNLKSISSNKSVKNPLKSPLKRGFKNPKRILLIDSTKCP